ncbi:beta-lactamase hydrolase domain-containing protein [Microbulbifer aggregans]|uniref:beta-lactamase hydrolase domain-containing protein n=1 Tax=Microbulbifer aggregans TaxID=1769779 RepID=UPI001CFC7B18|nr:protein tyrosine phosphatase family protein [Microbulbifer aggregans]
MKLPKVLVFLSVCVFALAAPFSSASGAEDSEKPEIQVPFGDKVGAEIQNYNRLRPNIATGGSIDLAQIKEIAGHGFRTVLDLRTPEEGTAEEKAAVEGAGMRYVNLPVSKGAPSEEVIKGIEAVLQDPDAGLVLIHCGSGNRVGTAWAIYRAKTGVPLDIAIEEGRTIGMRDSREEQVRALLSE